jgi:alpha-L-rhamnosidase
MISQGATALSELWEDKTGSAMNTWFYRALAGVNQEADSVGYRCVRIEPHPVEDLHWASGAIETIRGAVSSSWAHSSV